MATRSKPVEAAPTVSLSEHQVLIDRLEEMNTEFRAAAMLKFEDEGWNLVSGGRELLDAGPDLETLRDQVSPKLRTMVTANTLIKKIRLLRGSYIWSQLPNIPGSSSGGNGRPSNVAKFVNDPVNQANLFDSTAHDKMESSVITDGCYLLLGKTSSKQVRSIPLQQIVDVEVDSEFPDVIRAYKRRWDRWDPVTKSLETVDTWYYVESVPGNDRATKIKEVEVSQDYEMLDFWVNKQVGWALGVPDALAAAPWAQMYVELMQSGRVMTEALARFAARITNKTKAGSAQTGMKVAQAKGSGNIATMAQGNEMEIFASAGKTYDFNGIRPVAAMVAAGGEVSLVHLLSDPGAAGSSYGSAATLDKPTKNAVKQRQDAWSVFLKRVIRWATKTDVEVTFPPLDDDTYRKAQTVQLAHMSGLFHAEETRPAMAAAAGMVLTRSDVPKGYLLPNNEESLARRDIDTDGPKATAASPGQGVSSGTGGAGSTAANDIRTDLTAEILKSMDREELREFLQEILS